MDATGFVVAPRDHIVDGEVAETQSECIDLEEGEDEICSALIERRNRTASPNAITAANKVIDTGNS